MLSKADSSNIEEDIESGFAPSDLSDGREPYEWKTRWDDEAWRGIRRESILVGALFVLVPLATFLTWYGSPNYLLGLTERKYDVFQRYAYAGFGGLLGGAVFDVKWLVHCVAKGKWHQDRRLWRIFAPLVSASLAVIMALLAFGGVLPLIDESELQNPAAVFGVAFLVGYFSDKAIGAMAQIASGLMGNTDEHQHGKKRIV